MKKVSKMLTYIENTICVTCMLGMLAIAFANVIGRYVLSASFSATEEITTSLFVLLSVMGTAIAAKAKTHLGLTILVERFPIKGKRINGFWTNMLAAACCVILFVLGVQMVQNQMRLECISATLQVPTWIYGMALPIGAVFMTVRFTQSAIECLKMEEEVEAL